jgi:hypothetical protein
MRRLIDDLADLLLQALALPDPLEAPPQISPPGRRRPVLTSAAARRRKERV